VAILAEVRPKSANIRDKFLEKRSILRNRQRKFLAEAGFGPNPVRNFLPQLLLFRLKHCQLSCAKGCCGRTSAVGMKQFAPPPGPTPGYWEAAVDQMWGANFAHFGDSEGVDSKRPGHLMHSRLLCFYAE